MKTVVLDVRPPEKAMQDFVAAWKSGKAQRQARISFPTPELLLRAMCGAGPLTVREAARRVSRDIKAVHSDLTALVEAGVLERTASGQVQFPFEAIKVEFLLQAA